MVARKPEVSGSPEAILVLDCDGRFRRLTDSACGLIGRRSEILGRKLEDAWPAGSALRPLLADTLAGKPAISATLPLPRDGRSVAHAVTTQPLQGPEGITDVLVSIRSLELPVRELSSEEASRDLPVLGRLISHVAHKWRNSLNLFVLHTALLREKVRGKLPESGQHLDALDAEVTHLNHVIQGLMKFAASDHLEMQEIPIEALLHASAADFMGRGKNREIRVDVDVAPELPAVCGDRELLEQALLNLFAHARSTMQAGGALRVTAWHSSEDRVVLEVRDTSEGGAAAKSGESRDLELFIADRIVQLHGGRLESDVSSGGPPRFTLSLARAPR